MSNTVNISGKQDRFRIISNPTENHNGPTAIPPPTDLDSGLTILFYSRFLQIQDFYFPMPASAITNLDRLHARLRHVKNCSRFSEARSGSENRRCNLTETHRKLFTLTEADAISLSDNFTTELYG